MSRYPDTDWKTRQMLMRIETEYPTLTAEYLNHIGANELPIPVQKPDNDRKYLVWELWHDREFDTESWYRTDTSADMTGYMDSMTRKHRFDATEPPVPGAKKSKAKSNDNADS